MGFIWVKRALAGTCYNVKVLDELTSFSDFFFVEETLPDSNGGYLFVAGNGQDSFVVVDTSDSTSLSVAGSTGATSDLDGVSGLAQRGDYVYCANRNGGKFTVVDVSTRTAPTVVGVLANASLAGSNRAEVLGSDYVVVCSVTYDGIHVIDVSTPSAPSLVASITDARMNGCEYLEIVGDFAYVGTGNISPSAHGVTVVDLSTPASPTIVASLNTDPIDRVGGVQSISSQYLAVAGSGATNSQGFVVVDISTPSTPSVVGSAAYSPGFDGAFDLTVVGNVAVLGQDNEGDLDYGALEVVDVSDPTSPTIQSPIEYVPAVFYQAYRISSDGSTMFASDYTNSTIRSLALTCEAGVSA